MSKRLKSVQPIGWKRAGKLRDPSRALIEQAAAQARTGLAQANPSQSAKSPAGRVLVVIMVFVTIIIGLNAAGWVQAGLFGIAASFIFGLVGIIRGIAALIPLRPPQEFGGISHLQAAPVWTILVALYKEADSVPSLLTALSQLEWVDHQLDIIFACEADDHETLEVLQAHQKTYDFRIVRVEAGGPRTKPNALQTALPFARGRYLTVYDAEDRPGPQQLRAAFQAFLVGPANLAVVQAPLVTWNHNESWIARQFALDYAIWFRVMLPAFGRLSGFIPLGGTSNHFRTNILRQVGGWDPYNVTEDADLGVRLCRQGYHTSLITPPTYEEAPPRLSAWVKQRGRWIQGHMQTFSLHLRTPVSLLYHLGWRQSLAFFLGLGIGPMSALIFLPFLIGLLVGVPENTFLFVWTSWALGMGGQLLTAFVACQRDGRRELLGCAVTLPLYYCLQSVAACRAMWRVMFTPSIWDKTDHGCAARRHRDNGTVKGNVRGNVRGKGKNAWIGQQHSSFLG